MNKFLAFEQNSPQAPLWTFVTLSVLPQLAWKGHDDDGYDIADSEEVMMTILKDCAASSILR